MSSYSAETREYIYAPFTRHDCSRIIHWFCVFFMKCPNYTRQNHILDKNSILSFGLESKFLTNGLFFMLF